MKAFGWLMLCSIGLAPMLVQAAPDFSQPVGTTILDSGSDQYQFQQIKLRFENEVRHDRITVAIPRTTPPEAGFPVMYLLDGNAVIAELSDSLLAELATNPPVIVTLGYDTNLRFDLTARTRDYTPTGQQGETQIGKWQGGGAATFLTLITEVIQPQVAKLTQINSKQQGIWGHSFGGLFALYVLQQPTTPFTFYASADPAFWWMNGDQIQRLKQFAEDNPSLSPTQVLLMHGEKLKKPPTDASTQRFQYDVTETNQSLVAELDNMDDLSADYKGYQLSHGPLFKIAFEDALRWFSQQTHSQH